MNYLRQILTFERWCETHPLHATAQLMWYKLLYLCNSSGWSEWIGVDNRRLMLMIGTTDEKTMMRHRQKLLERELIQYKRGKKGRPSQYKLLDFTGKKEGQVPVYPPGEPPDLVKEKEKQKRTTPLPPKEGMGDVFAGLDSSLLETVEEWIAYKSEKKQPYRTTGQKKLAEEIRHHAQRHGSPAVCALIQQCMSSNYNGIIWDKLESSPGGETAKKQNPALAYNQRSYDDDEMWDLFE